VEKDLTDPDGLFVIRRFIVKRRTVAEFGPETPGKSAREESGEARGAFRR
jgi:hypothetical protein